MILEMTRPVQGGLRQERKLEGVSNNLANVDTVGFKKDVISFDRKFQAQFKYECPINLLRLQEPVQISCGHRFCRGCIVR